MAIVYIDKKEIKEIIISLAEQIQNRYHQKPLVLICPLIGSMVFMSDLARHLNMPLEIDFVHLTNSDNTIRLSTDIACDIENKHVLIVKEIMDEGRKIKFLKERLFLSNPKSIKIAALLDKTSRRTPFLEADFIGKSIEDRFVVGYGMDNNLLGRNYPSIYTLKQ